MILQPYLHLNGNCEEAMHFYAQCFNGTISSLNRYEGSPMDVPENYRNKIMHGEVVFENNRIAMCDVPPGAPMPAGSSISMMITLMEVFILDEVFNKVAEGGTVTMPLQDTFWGSRFGMITDKYGINWMFSCDLN